MSERCHCAHVDIIIVKLTHIEDTLETLTESLKEEFVTKDQFTPVRRVVFWGLSIFGTGIAGLGFAYLTKIIGLR